MYDISKIAYQIVGKGQPILFLHGWGQSHHAMLKFSEQLTNYQCLFVDLPGFGNSIGLKDGIRVEEMAKIIKLWLDSIDVKPLLIVGHSYGGKVGYCLSLKYLSVPVFLCAPSLIKPRRKLKYYPLVFLYKLKKKLYKYKILNNHPHGGSKDLRNCDDNNRQTFLLAIRRYFDQELKSNTLPITLYWGKDDQETPLCQGKKIQKLTKCQLFIVKGGHFAYLENIFTCSQKIKEVMDGMD